MPLIVNYIEYPFKNMWHISMEFSSFIAFFRNVEIILGQMWALHLKNGLISTSALPLNSTYVAMPLQRNISGDKL
jgi:hypothetical protein